MAKGTGWDEVESSSFGKSWDSTIEKFDFTVGEWSALRLLGEVFKVRFHWVPTLKKQGGSETSYPILCRKNLDTDEESFDCPCCNAGMTTQTVFLTNAIVRDLQENKPEGKKSKQPDKEYREAGDKFWSPIRVVKIPAGTAQKVKNLSKLNKISKNGKITTYQVDHPKYGRDINILFDPSQSGSGMYDVQKDDHTPLTDEERAYLLFNLERVYEAVPEVNDMISSLRKSYDKELFSSDNCNFNSLKEILLGNDEDLDLTKSKKSKKSKKVGEDDEDDVPVKKTDKKKSKKVEEDTGSDDTGSDDDVPVKKTDKKKSKKVEEDTGSDDDDDEDTGSDDDVPVKKIDKKKSKKVEEDTGSDDDDDDEDTGSDDDVPVKKIDKKKSKKVEKDTGSDDDDEDEPKKSSKKSKK